MASMDNTGKGENKLASFISSHWISSKIVLIIMLIVMTIAGFYLTCCMETKEERRIDLQTMRIETIVWSGYYGTRKHRDVRIYETLVSGELRMINETTGLNGIVTFYRYERSLHFCYGCIPEFRERGVHLVQGDRVKSITCSYKVAELIERNGQDALPYLRRIIIEAQDRVKYPKWNIQEVERDVNEMKLRKWGMGGQTS